MNGPDGNGPSDYVPPSDFSIKRAVGKESEISRVDPHATQKCAGFGAKFLSTQQTFVGHTRQKSATRAAPQVIYAVIAMVVEVMRWAM